MKVSLNPRLNKNLSTNTYEMRTNNSQTALASVPFNKADVISFGNAETLPKVLPEFKQIFVGAELEGFVKAGGVATVMGDYLELGQPMVLPYYNGEMKYDPKTGNPTGKVEPIIYNGKPIFTTEDLDTKSIEQIVKEGKFTELEEVSSKTMAWGKEETTPIKLYKVKNKEKFPNLYLVYTDATAKMKKPYDAGVGNYSSEGGIPITKHWEGDPYAKFDKAFVEFMDKYGVKEGTVVCSDAQTAYIPHYMAEKTLQNDSVVEKLKPSYVAHNLGEGYQGTTSARNMLVNIGLNKEQIGIIESNPEYLEALKKGTEEEYLKKFIPELLDTEKQPNPIKIIMKQRKEGYIVAFDTVSEEYANAIANNPRMAKSIQSEYMELLKEGKAGGILNALNNPKLGYDKPPLLNGYVNPVELKDAEGKVIEVIEPFKVFPTNANADEIIKIKAENKKNLFKRLSGKYTDNRVLTGLPGKKAELIGTIDPKWIQKIEAGEDVKLFSSCGRGDFQKALDTVLDAFEIFAKTPEGKNAVLVFGGELPEGSAETEKILSKLKLLLADERYKGRICCMNGFAPWIPMASASDMALLPSRFAPCELTDLEAIKYLCTPNVTNTQGLRQKNFDPRDAVNADIATSYRTKTEFFCPIEEALDADEKLKKLYNELYVKEKTKLTLRNVDAAKIDELTQANVLKSSKFSNALRDSVDARIAQELSDNMVEFVKRPKSLVEKMFENQKKINTKWWENGLLHPTKQSTGELYKIKHFEAECVKPKKPLFNFIEKFQEITKKIETFYDDVAQNLSKNEIIEQFKKSGEFKGIIKKYYAFAAGAAAVSFAAGALIANYNKKQNKTVKPLIHPQTPAPTGTANNAIQQRPVSFPSFVKK